MKPIWCHECRYWQMIERARDGGGRCWAEPVPELRNEKDPACRHAEPKQ